MKKINNKGFTLIEILAVVVIIAILGLIAVPSVISIIKNSNQSSYDILIENIGVAGRQLFEEVEYVGNKLYKYSNDGITSEEIKIINGEDGNEIHINLQSLVSNGFLTGINNSDTSGDNKNYKIITSPKTSKDIGQCVIVITKVVDSNSNVDYRISVDNENDICPVNEDYDRILEQEVE